jgi:MFS family permease
MLALEGRIAVDSRRHDVMLAAVLAVNFGVAFLARNALGLAAPYIQVDIPLTNADIGALSAGLACAWAAAGIAATRLLESRFNTLALLIGFCLVDALSLTVAATARTFTALFLARILTGMAAGPVLPLSQALIARRGGAGNRGLRMGATQALGGSLIGGILAPWFIIPLSQGHHWQGAFLATAACCLLSAGLLQVLPRHLGSTARSAQTDHSNAERRTTRSSPHNVVICSSISALMLGWLVIVSTFLPTVLIRGLAWPATRASLAMSAIGALSLLSSIIVPSLSDRVGRRPAFVAAAAAGALATAGIGAATGGRLIDLALLSLAGIAGGTFPLFMATIPAESARPGQTALAIAWVQGVGEIVGGLLAPVLAGLAADRFGIINIVWIAAACAGLATASGWFLAETRPALGRPKHSSYR